MRTHTHTHAHHGPLSSHPTCTHTYTGTGENGRGTHPPLRSSPALSHPVPPRRWALTRPRLTRAPDLLPPRSGVQDPAQKLALQATSPHLAPSHLSARAEGARRGEGVLTLLLLTAGRHMLPLPGQRPEGHFFPPGGRKREGAGPAAAGAAAGVPAGCAASSGDGPRTTSPRLLRAAPAS